MVKFLHLCFVLLFLLSVFSERLLLVSFSVFSDRRSLKIENGRSLKIENENNNTKTLRPQKLEYIEFLVYKYRSPLLAGTTFADWHIRPDFISFSDFFA